MPGRDLLAELPTPPTRTGRDLLATPEPESRRNAQGWDRFTPQGFISNRLQELRDPELAASTRSDLMSRASILPTMVEHGLELGASDEAEGLRASNRQNGIVGQGINLMNSLSPAGRFAEAATGLAVDALLPDEQLGEAFTTARDEVRRDVNAARSEHPLTSFGAEMAGGGAIPVGSAGRGGLTTVQQGLRMVPASAGVGAAYGFADNDGDTGDRGEAAVFGAWLGGMLGFGFGAGGQLLARQGGRSRATTVSPDNSPAQNTSVILDAAPESAAPVRRQDLRAFTTILRQSGLSSDDVNGVLMRIQERAQSVDSPALFARLVTEALEESHPQAAENVRRVWRQMQLSPSSKDDTGSILTSAIDDQSRAQEQVITNTLDDVLGPQSIADEQAALGAERAAIGEARDTALSGIMRDGRNRGLPNRAQSWADEFADDAEVRGIMRSAARDLGHGGKSADSINAAIAADPVAFLNKFQELAFKQSKTGRGVTPVAESARMEAQQMLDDATRFAREDGSHAFAPRNAGEVGPYKQHQREFSANYSQEEAIETAMGKLADARDPFKSDQFVRWFDDLPGGEQDLVRTVLRNDIAKMIRGGNFSEDMPYLVNIDKRGVHDVLVRVLGEDGTRLSRFLDDMRREQVWLTSIDPRPKNGQPRYALSARENAAAANLYTPNPLGRFSRRNAVNTAAQDLPGMIASQMTIGVPIPPMSVARAASMPFRPSARTREGLARILTRRVGGRNQRQRANAAPMTPAPVAPSGPVNALANPTDTAPPAMVPAPEPQPTAPAYMPVSEMRQSIDAPNPVTASQAQRMRQRSEAAQARLSDAEQSLQESRRMGTSQGALDQSVRNLFDARDAWVSARLEMGETLDDIYQKTGRRFIASDHGFIDGSGAPADLTGLALQAEAARLSTEPADTWPDWFRHIMYERQFRHGDSIPDFSLDRMAYMASHSREQQIMRVQQEKRARRESLMRNTRRILAVGGLAGGVAYLRQRDDGSSGPPGISDASTIKDAQTILTELNYLPPASVDGIIGNNTRRALRQFQEEMELEPTGRLTDETLASLRRQQAAQPLIPSN